MPRALEGESRNRSGIRERMSGSPNPRSARNSSGSTVIAFSRELTSLEVLEKEKFGSNILFTDRNSIQLSPEGEVNSGGKIETRSVEIYGYFGKGRRKKCTRQSRKVLREDLRSLFFIEILKERYERPWTMFPSAKAKPQKYFDSYSVRNSVIISHITFRDCRVPFFFLTTFLEIAVYLVLFTDPEGDSCFSSLRFN